jgi:hypothetical protein
MRRTFAGFVPPLLAALALLSPGMAVAEPPENAAGMMAPDEVAEGLQSGLVNAVPGKEGWTLASTSVVRRGGGQERQGRVPGRRLFTRGAERFLDEDYVSADVAFSRIVNECPDGCLAPVALLGAIMAKAEQMRATESRLRRLRLCVESRRLILKANEEYPDLVYANREFFARRTVGIVHDEAEVAYASAEWLEERHHHFLAYGCYQYVRANYSMCHEGDKAKERQERLFQWRRNAPHPDLPSPPPFDR